MDPTQMTPQEKDLLNAYHARVHAAIAPHLPPGGGRLAGPGHPSYLRN
ncbi:MAG: M24 family metallopeptidase C-terminal domain-containing protein [Evtepia sp.]